jgi:hypothetical protein
MAPPRRLTSLVELLLGSRATSNRKVPRASDADCTMVFSEPLLPTSVIAGGRQDAPRRLLGPTKPVIFRCPLSCATYSDSPRQSADRVDHQHRTRGENDKGDLQRPKPRIDIDAHGLGDLFGRGCGAGHHLQQPIVADEVGAV